MDLLTITIICFLCAFVSAAIAQGKRRNSFLWFLAGLFLGPFGLLVALLPAIESSKNKSQAPARIDFQTYLDGLAKKCPECAEQIKLEALKCRFCGKQFNESDVASEVEKARVDFASLADRMIDGRYFCPRCHKWEAYKTQIGHQLIGKWCPNCNEQVPDTFQSSP